MTGAVLGRDRFVTEQERFQFADGKVTLGKSFLTPELCVRSLKMQKVVCFNMELHYS